MRSFIALVLVLLIEASVHADCVPSRVMFVLDRSSSMNDYISSGRSKWDAGLAALGEAVNQLEERAEVGLMLFPAPDRCAPGEVVLDMGSYGAGGVVAAAGRPPLVAGAYTPLAATVDALADYPPLLEANDSHVVLVTDGWEWCDPYDRTARFGVVGAVSRLRELGVTVHVVGFGSGVDALALGRAAIAGGAFLPGCDPELSDPHGEGHCYHHAGESVDLASILAEIARDIGDERCDGVDDDCDGLIDEGFDADGDGYTTCGPRPDCDDSDSGVHPDGRELCDGRDGNCDGSIDVGCACREGARPCGGFIAGRTQGPRLCVDGTWTVGEGGTIARRESCNGFDDDCDGETDEFASCPDGSLCIRSVCEPLEPELPPASVMPEPEAEPVIPPPPGCNCAVGATASDPHVLWVLPFLIAIRRLLSIR